GPPRSGWRRLSPEPPRLTPPAYLLPGGVRVPDDLRVTCQPPNLLQCLEEVCVRRVGRCPGPHPRRLLRRTATGHETGELGARCFVDLVDEIPSTPHSRRP